MSIWQRSLVFEHFPEEFTRMCLHSDELKQLEEDYVKYVSSIVTGLYETKKFKRFFYSEEIFV